MAKKVQNQNSELASVSLDIVKAQLQAGQIDVDAAYKLCLVNDIEVGFADLIPHLPKASAKVLGVKMSVLDKVPSVNPMLFDNVVKACQAASKDARFDKAAVIASLQLKSDQAAEIQTMRETLKSARENLKRTDNTLLGLTAFLASHSENLSIPVKDGKAAIGLRVTIDGSIVGELPDSAKTADTVDWRIGQSYIKGYNARKDADGRIIRDSAVLTIRIDSMDGENMVITLGTVPAWSDLISGAVMEKTSPNQILKGLMDAGQTVSAPRAFHYCKDLDGRPMN